MSANMFGVLASGRLVQTDFQQISETQFLINVQDADSVNHLVVFLTGQTPFPDGYGGSVYLKLPNPNGPSWVYLGFISNEKPSAIFKISKLKANAAEGSANMFGQPIGDQVHTGQIGISIEMLSQIAHQSAVSIASVSNLEPFVEFSQKMVQNLFNFVSSFAQTQSQMTPAPLETFVPMSSIQKWYEQFERKTQQNPYFWRS